MCCAMKYFCISILLKLISGSANHLSVKIFENSPINQTLVNLKSELERVQPDAYYQSLSGLSRNPFFHVNKDWQLIAKMNLDRDRNPELCNERTKEHQCIWSGLILLDNPTSIISLKVEIEDINDNAPSWSQPIVIEIPEHIAARREFELPTAQDDDSPPNNVRNYKLLSHPYESIFQLDVDHASGIIPRLIIRTALDHEKQSKYVLTLCATDGASPYHEGFVNITIVVLDQNDNSPEFPRNHFSISIPEDYPLHTPLMLNISATDKDSGRFGQIAFSISGSQAKKFAINKNTGDITLKEKLDYDIGEYYFKFFVIARDHGVPPMSASSTVEVKVTDVNDQPPIILVNTLNQIDTGGFLTITFMENNLIDQTVARITATDKDSIESDYCNCTLAPFSDFKLTFERNIDRTTIYRLQAAVVFDREVSASVRVVITCFDVGSSPMTSTQTLNVIIEDMNDNQPVFEKPLYNFMVPEGNLENTIIEKLNASDEDIGNNGKISYRIASSSDSNKIYSVFTINENGEIIAKGVLDREKNLQGYKFKVIATDHGIPQKTGSTNVEVNLLDINDCEPKFTKDMYHFQIDEDDGIFGRFKQRPIGSVKAIDEDIDTNSISYYDLTPKHSPFEVTKDGYLKTKNIVDREVQSSYFLKVRAIDGTEGSNKRHTATSIINITVIDINDNEPVFRFPINSSKPINVSVYEEPGFMVKKVEATDIDEGDNGRISYRIMNGNIHGLFSIDSESGQISIINSIHRTLQAPTIPLTILARDYGTPSKSAAAVLLIRMTDTPPTGDKRTDPENQYSSSTQTNQILIMIIVTITCIICIGLITVICLMVRGIAFRQRYCKALAVDERNSTLSRYGYCPGMLPVVETNIDGIGDCRNSFLENTYCTLQFPPPSYSSSKGQPYVTDTFPCEHRIVNFTKLFNEQANGSDSDSGHGTSTNNQVPADSKDNLAFTTFGTFTSQPAYIPISSVGKLPEITAVSMSSKASDSSSTFKKFST